MVGLCGSSLVPEMSGTQTTLRIAKRLVSLWFGIRKKASPRGAKSVPRAIGLDSLAAGNQAPKELSKLHVGTLDTVTQSAALARNS
jgi:hypothetical protein